MPKDIKHLIDQIEKFTSLYETCKLTVLDLASRQDRLAQIIDKHGKQIRELQDNQQYNSSQSIDELGLNQNLDYLIPSNELVNEWLCDDWFDSCWDENQKTICVSIGRLHNVAQQAAQWGANQMIKTSSLDD
jgi:hypothetical protein